MSNNDVYVIKKNGTVFQTFGSDSSEATRVCESLKNADKDNSYVVEALQQICD